MIKEITRFIQDHASHEMENDSSRDLQLTIVLIKTKTIMLLLLTQNVQAQEKKQKNVVPDLATRTLRYFVCVDRSCYTFVRVQGSQWSKNWFRNRLIFIRYNLNVCITAGKSVAHYDTTKSRLSFSSKLSTAPNDEILADNVCNGQLKQIIEVIVILKRFPSET